MSEAEFQNFEPKPANQSAVGAPAAASENDRSSSSPAQRAWRRFRKNRPAVLAAWYLSALLAIIIAWPVILGIAKTTGPGGAAWAKAYAPEQLSDTQFQKPGAQHWFGTDEHGRDVLSRVLYGAQISLLVGVVGAAVSLVIGVLWGSIAGFAGGR